MLSTKDKKEAVMQKFDKQAFIAEVKDNVKKLYRKNIEEADKQQIFQAVGGIFPQTPPGGNLV